MKYKTLGKRLLASRPDQQKTLGGDGSRYPEFPGGEQITLYQADDRPGLKWDHALYLVAGKYYLHGTQERKTVAISELEALRDYIEWSAPHELLPRLHEALDALAGLMRTTVKEVNPPRRKKVRIVRQGFYAELPRSMTNEEAEAMLLKRMMEKLESWAGANLVPRNVHFTALEMLREFQIRFEGLISGRLVHVPDDRSAPWNESPMITRKRFAQMSNAEHRELDQYGAVPQ